MKIGPIFNPGMVIGFIECGDIICCLVQGYSGPEGSNSGRSFSQSMVFRKGIEGYEEEKILVIREKLQLYGIMKAYSKKDYPVSKIRRYLEPGPVVLVSCAWKGKSNIMTMGWHMMLEFSPALFGCCISNVNYSFEMIRKAKECVINIPTLELVNEVVGIGNCSGAQIDKFSKFSLTPVTATKVQAPLIRECYANFECKLAEGRLISQYCLFVWEVVKAHVATSPKYPKTIHYRGEGAFMVSGRSLNLCKKFKTQNL
jgi:flavin reductase (DIM6/NTAB) family NADH-FMN oxidoreductase RutF